MLSLLKSRRTWVVTISVALGLVFVWYLAAYPRGMLMAYIDHSRGHFEIKTFGGFRDESRRQLLESRYGVKLTSVAGCVITPDVEWYIEGYNSASRSLLAEKHGLDVFEECRRLAREGVEE